jgi:calcium-dependent protein kinase
MNFVDIDSSGFIDYSEFITASINKNKILTNQNINTCFTLFDKDSNGTISV